MQLKGTDWSQVLADLRSELADDSKFPITAARWAQIVGVNPSDIGRGGDIELNGDVLQQDGDAGTLLFEFTDANGSVKATMDVGRTIVGQRVISGDIVEWLPDSTRAPQIKFPNSPAYQTTLGGPVAQMYISTNRFVVGNGKQCLAAAY